MTETGPNPFLTAAMEAAAHGWRVFPLRPNDKRPAVRDWEARATTDPDRITRCWSAGPFNIGVACGPSGLVVLDLDQPKPDDSGAPVEWQMPGVRSGEDVLAVLAERAGQPLPYDTHLVRTGRGGLHAYYTAPDGVSLRNTAGRLGWLIDTRAAGGYVVATGSRVNDRRYELLYEAPTAPLPSWLVDLLRPQPAIPAEPVTLPNTARLSAYLTAALQAEAAQVRDATSGQRNHALFIAAQALGQLVASGALTAEQVRHVLVAASAEHVAAGAYTERERDATITSGLRAGARRPRRVAA